MVVQTWSYKSLWQNSSILALFNNWLCQIMHSLLECNWSLLRDDLAADRHTHKWATSHYLITNPTSPKDAWLFCINNLHHFYWTSHIYTIYSSIKRQIEFFSKLFMSFLIKFTLYRDIHLWIVFRNFSQFYFIKIAK